MTQPLYFLPSLTWTRDQTEATTRLILKDRGLSEIFRDVKRDEIGFQELAGRGPDDKSGSIIWYSDNREPPRRCGYYKTEQDWHDCGAFYIGIDTASPPTPADLRRKREHAGYPLELADGNQWMIPVVRRPNDTTELPTDLYVDAAGNLCEPIKPAYQKYWEAGKEVCEWVYGGIEPKTITALNLAIDALGLNYRYGPAEHAILRYIDKENFVELLQITVDMPYVRKCVEAQKKTA
jgi:hypothetical protein